MRKAAGILFVSPKGNALFLRRSSAALDFPGHWDFPGGHAEGDETFEQAAAREAEEEIGPIPPGSMTLHVRTKGSAPEGAVGLGAPPVLPVPAGAPAAPPTSSGPTEPVDFATFLQKVGDEFVPKLNHEHDGWAWAPTKSPPEPLHPGCRIALSRISMNELDVARAIVTGELTSPQFYENVWLFAIRITGTDVAYRNVLDEYVVRRPENYLNDEFLARCNGLPVIYVQRSGKDKGFHPKGALLNSDEFAERIVGTIFLPYIAGDEVWGIAKIYDAAAASAMEEKDLSTSPSVFFREPKVNSKLELENGAKLLIEGNPSLLDHVTICEQGVWDKGGPPSGVRSESREDSAMTPEEQAAADKAKKDAEEAETKRKADEEEAKKKADAEVGTALDKTLSHIADSLASMHKRMDAIEDLEKKRGDAAKKDAEDKEEEAKRLAADKAKKDAEEAEKAEKEKADKAKKDAEDKAKADAFDARTAIAEVKAMLPKSIGDADYHAMTDAQARADAVFSHFGKHAPRPLQGETPGLYERRCVRELKAHSPTWKSVELAGAAFADDASFEVVRDQVYADAVKTAMSPATVEAGTLRMITKRSGGHEIHEFVGDPRSWMDPMAGATRHFVTAINVPK